jgi:hypothetical protein
VSRPGPVALAAVGCVLALVAAASGCSTGEADREPAAADGGSAGGDARPASRDGDHSTSRDRERSAPLRRATCPASAANCRSASGRVIYVERVDPDGDGDAHFVLASRDSVTGPGISVIDVRRSLRPSPLPGPGDRLNAAGPVYRGSYGQRQIEATELHVAR